VLRTPKEGRKANIKGVAIIIVLLYLNNFLPREKGNNPRKIMKREKL